MYKCYTIFCDLIRTASGYHCSFYQFYMLFFGSYNDDNSYESMRSCTNNIGLQDLTSVVTETVCQQCRSVCTYQNLTHQSLSVNQLLDARGFRLYTGIKNLTQRSITNKQKRFRHHCLIKINKQSLKSENASLTDVTAADNRIAVIKDATVAVMLTLAAKRAPHLYDCQYVATCNRQETPASYRWPIPI